MTEPPNGSLVQELLEVAFGEVRSPLSGVYF